MILRACYVACDTCGDPAEVTTDDAREARAIARSEGFSRVKVDGKWLDVCRRHPVAPSVGKAGEERGE